MFAIIVSSLVSCQLEDTDVGVTPSNVASPISINNTGVVPLLSDSATNGIIYIHNNSANTINGITYTVKNNDQTPNNLSVSNMQCTTIAAHSRCALSFTINSLADTVAQSSAIITANVTNDYKFSQVINYAKIFNNTSQGIFINSDVMLANFGNSTSYATVYAYGGAGGSYTLTNFVADNSQITVDNSSFGKVIANNEIVAIEVSTTTNNISTNLNINAINSANSTYSTKIGIATTPSSDGAILTSGYAPIVNTGSTTTGSFAIVNAGNITATFGTITYPTGTSSNASTTCGTTLAAHTSCTIYFTITASTASNGNISIPYTGGTGGTLTQTVTWYNSKGGGALVQMVSSSSTVSMITGGSSNSSTITVTNLGAYSLTSITVPTTTIVSGSATVTVTSDTCTGTSLSYGSSCTYVINVSDTVSETLQQINVGISGSYNNGNASTYSRVLAVNYTSAVVTALSTNANFTCALKNGSSVSCWGNSTTGSLGGGTIVLAPTLATLPSGVSSWTSVSTNSNTTCAIANTGALYCWGYGINGQIGNGASYNVSIPTAVTAPSGVSSWTSVSTTTTGACAIASTGALYCWGAGSTGQIGNGSTSNATVPTAVTVPSGVSSWTSMAIGANNSCAIANTGALYCWGGGSNGQIGNGANTSVVNIPTAVTVPNGVSSWTSVVTSPLSSVTSFICAIANTGALYCWGAGATNGTIGNGASSNVNVPTAVSTTNTGTVSWSSMSLNTQAACAITTAGAMYCWGIGTVGQIGNGGTSSVNLPTAVSATSGVSTWSSVATSMNSSCAIAGSGTNAGALYCWGSGSTGQIGNGASSNVSVPTAVTAPTGVLTWASVSVSQLRTCAISATVSSGTAGTMYCWGNSVIGNSANAVNVNTPSAVTVPSGVSSWSAVSANNSYSCAITATVTSGTAGSIYCWGTGNFGQIGNNATSAGNPAAITTTSGVSSWSSIATNTATTCAIAGSGTNSGNIYCWGTGSSGEVGNGTANNQIVPTLSTLPGAVSSWSSLQMGTSFVCAMSSASSIYCWGLGTSGQIGNTANASKNIPTAITVPSGVSSWTSMAVGLNFSCAIANTGALYCWGLGTSGQIGNGGTASESRPIAVTVPSGVSSWSQVATYVGYACALASSGANSGNIYCWGLGTSGQIGNSASVSVSVPTQVTLPTGVSTWSSIVSSLTTSSTTCATAATGTNAGKIYCWGAGTSGQIGNGSTSNVNLPTAITLPTGVLTWSSMSSNESSSCAISATVSSGTAGSLYCWGLGTSGQIGNGSSSTVSVPTAVTLPSGVTLWKNVATNTNFSCAIAGSGTNVNNVYCWGLGTGGQLGDSIYTTHNVPTATSALP